MPAPTDEALQALHSIITGLLNLLTFKGVLIEEQGQTYIAADNSDSDEAWTPVVWGLGAIALGIAEEGELR